MSEGRNTLADRILDLRRQGKTQRQIAAAVRCAPSTVHATLKAHGDPLAGKWGGTATPADPPPAESLETSEWSEGGDAATLRGDTRRAIRTEEDVYAAFEIDRTRWVIEKMTVKAWQAMAKVGSEAAGYRTETVQLYAVTAHLKRVVTKAVEKALDLVFARFKDAAPKWPKVDKDRAAKGEPFLAVMGLMDAHFGKYCWEGETGENYDLKIAEAVFANAVEDLLAESRHRNVTRFVLPFGNDFMHFDGRDFKTTRGTPQDADGRFSKVLATAIKAVTDGVEKMAAVAPVQVELVPGNHDRTLAECICHTIAARFHHTERVAVNVSPKTRKYVRFGATLLGLTHGDMVKAEKLPGLMAAEAKREWADTSCHEWIIGHGHRSQKWVTKDVDTQQGTVVRMLRALTRSDLWHHDSGYVTGAEYPAAEVYFYGRDRGYAGHAIVPARG